MTAQQYCLSRSWRLRLRRKDSEWLIREAIKSAQGGYLASKHTLSMHLKFLVRTRYGLVCAENGEVKYGNPILIWFLLNIIVPVVVRLVIEWWLNQMESLR